MRKHSPSRRNILLALLTTIVAWLSLFLIAYPRLVSLTPQVVSRSRLIYSLSTSLLTAALIGLVYRYLAPTAHLGRLLCPDGETLVRSANQEESILEVIHQSRQVAFGAPAYLFALLLGGIMLTILLSNLVGLLFMPGYQFSSHVSEALIGIFSGAGAALELALITRWQLRPILLLSQKRMIKLEKEQARLQAIQDISTRISAIFELDQLLEELVQGIKTNLGYYNTLIFLIDEEELYLAASSRLLASEVKDRRFKIGSKWLVSRVAKTKNSALIPDVTQCDFCAPSSSVIRSKMSVPILMGGILVGILEVESDRVEALTEHDMKLMSTLANQIAASIEVVQLLQESQINAVELERRANNLMLINSISTTLTSSLDASEILSQTVKHLVELSQTDYGSVFILEQERQQGVITAEYPTQQFTGQRFSLPDLPSLYQKLEMGIPHAIEDIATHPFWTPFQEQLDIRSLLLTPLVARKKIIGILFLASREQSRIFSSEERELCQTVASQAAVAVANARLLRDIQQQKRALARKSQELTEESSKLDAILRNIADGLVVTDPAGRIILSNPVFRKMADQPPDHSLRGMLLVGCFSDTGLQSTITRALEAPDQVFTKNLELPNKQVLKVSATAMRLQSTSLAPEQKDQIAGVATVLRDITHEVEVDRMKTDFISAVSHELRSPLTAILGFTDLIKRDFRRLITPHINIDEEANRVMDHILENITIIENESERLTRLINDLLNIAKMEAGQIEWNMTKINLEVVIQRAVVATAALAQEKKLAPRIHLPPQGIPPVRGHKDQLIQVMTNLLSNAVKFTEQGYIEVQGRILDSRDGTVSIGEAVPLTFHSIASLRDTLISFNLSEGKWAMISVVDTGAGIPSKDMSRIFEKFTQVGETLTEKPDGTGLGLAICKEIITRHEGYIWAESKRGQGSAFSFVLPLW